VTRREHLDLIEAGWLPPGAFEAEARRRLVLGEPLCGLTRLQAIAVARRLFDRGVSFGAIAATMPLLFGPAHAFSRDTWRHRLRAYGAPMRQPRGVPFPRRRDAHQEPTAC
jgi:hypothetical protein